MHLVGSSLIYLWLAGVTFTVPTVLAVLRSCATIGSPGSIVSVQHVDKGPKSRQSTLILW